MRKLTHVGPPGLQRTQRVADPAPVNETNLQSNAQTRVESFAPRALSVPKPPTDWSRIIQRELPEGLQPIAQAMSTSWDFLYQRARPDAPPDTKGLVFTQRRTEAAGKGVTEGLKLLEKSQASGEDLLSPASHVGTGKALVMGGGYEVDLLPLLGKFAEVHVVDMSDEPLKLVAEKYKNHPHFNRLRFIQADLSGISTELQVKELERGHKDTARHPSGVDAEQTRTFFEAVPENVGQLRPFKSGDYNMVVSPVLHESLPFGPLVERLETLRFENRGENGEPGKRQAVDDAMGEAFFYRPEVRAASDSVFRNHQAELKRLLAPGGVAVFSSWMRPDEHQAKHAPNEEPLVRVGDSRMTRRDWTSVLEENWGQENVHPVIERQRLYAPEMEQMKAEMNVFVFQRD